MAGFAREIRTRSAEFAESECWSAESVSKDFSRHDPHGGGDEAIDFPRRPAPPAPAYFHPPLSAHFHIGEICGAEKLFVNTRRLDDTGLVGATCRKLRKVGCRASGRRSGPGKFGKVAGSRRWRSRGAGFPPRVFRQRGSLPLKVRFGGRAESFAWDTVQSRMNHGMFMRRLATLLS